MRNGEKRTKAERLESLLIGLATGLTWLAVGAGLGALLMLLASCGPSKWYYAARTPVFTPADPQSSFTCVLEKLEADGFKFRQTHRGEQWTVAERDTPRRRALTNLWVIRDRVAVTVEPADSGPSMLVVGIIEVWVLGNSQTGRHEEEHEGIREAREYADWLASGCGRNP